MADLVQLVQHIMSGEDGPQSERLCELLQNVLFADETELVVSENVRKMSKTVLNDESAPFSVSRQYLIDLVSCLLKLSEERPQVAKSILREFVPMMQSRHIWHEGKVMEMYIQLAKFYEKERNFKDGSTMLKTIPLESGQRTYPPTFKLEVYMKLAEYATHFGDGNEAETYINRAMVVANELKDNKRASLAFKMHHAQVLSYRKKFVDAARRLDELAMSDDLDTESKTAAMTSAIICTVFAPAGAKRSRLLGTFYNNESYKSIPSYSIIKNMYLEKVIKREEIADFERSLKYVQRSWPGYDVESDKECLFLEHNILALSKSFISIKLSELSVLLFISIPQVQVTIARMITDNQLNATMDLVDDYVRFKHNDSLKQWDDDINYFCQKANTISDMITLKHKL